MHLRHRPTTLDEVVGNIAIKKVLREYLETNAHNPIMFVGLRGSGKTTLALIVAHEFGASNENITDLNCVYFSKIEDMRERLDSLFKTSLFGAKKVLVLDEIHELSAKTKNVLLKPLENLPHNILILACTTAPEKVDKTLLDRFSVLKVQPLQTPDAVQLLNTIALKEGIELPKWKKVLLVNKSEGIPRKLLTGLDAIKSINDVEEAESILDVSSLEDDKDALEIMKGIVSGLSWKQLVPILESALKQKSEEQLRIGLLNLIAGRLMSKYFDGNNKIIYLRDCLLEIDGKVPTKANFITAIYKGII